MQICRNRCVVFIDGLIPHPSIEQEHGSYKFATVSTTVSTTVPTVPRKVSTTFASDDSRSCAGGLMKSVLSSLLAATGDEARAQQTKRKPRKGRAKVKAEEMKGRRMQRVAEGLATNH